MRIPLAAALLLLCALRASAQTEALPPVEMPPAEAVAAPDTQLFDAMVVSGVQPGPGLWRVSRGDNVMWVLGTLTPLPKKMEWVSREVEQVIAESREVLLGPGATLKDKIGMFRGLLLLPAALGSRKNPEGEKLVEIVPAELYARWTPLKAKYIGRSRGIEKQRPLFAALKLYEKAIKKNRMTQESVVLPLVKKLAKKHKVPVNRPEIEIDIGNPREAINDFADSRLEDLDCFAGTLDRLETDLDTMRERANAWATGDIDALRSLPFTDQNQICAGAILQAGFTRERGLDDMRERLAAAWLAAAETALANNKSTFAILPMREVLGAGGYIETLRSRGYEVEEP
jgi:hypothetical protein